MVGNTPGAEAPPCQRTKLSYWNRYTILAFAHNSRALRALLACRFAHACTAYEYLR
eukprot:COSAG04_NODE_988_length_8943_cov_36.879579_7_plen_56_part_00